MKLFFDIVAIIMGFIFVLGISTLAYNRIVDGPPCYKVAEHSYVCNF